MISALPPPQIQCLAQGIYGEARGENELGQRAVGHVILNRSKKTGLTTCQVIRQPGQFKFKMKQKCKEWDKYYELARQLGNDPTNGAVYFKTVKCKIHWKYKLTTTIGHHNFYK